MRTCRTCKYAEESDFVEGMADAGYYGYCHRYPPFRCVDSGTGSFKEYNNIFPDDWCGEWCSKTKVKKHV